MCHEADVTIGSQTYSEYSPTHPLHSFVEYTWRYKFIRFDSLSNDAKDQTLVMNQYLTAL